MGIWNARRGGAVRWARGAVITLFAVLAVLVHHEVAAVAVSPEQSPVPAVHGMPGVPFSAAAAVPMGATADHPGHTQMLSASRSADGAGAGVCAGPGIQHCATAGVDSVKLTAPAPGPVEPAAALDRALADAVLARTVGRAPPDLSVLSQLRI